MRTAQTKSFTQITKVAESLKLKMLPFTWKGARKVADLIEARLALADIVDRYGRPVHEDAVEFCSSHKQAKRILIKRAMTDAQILTMMRAQHE